MTEQLSHILAFWGKTENSRNKSAAEEPATNLSLYHPAAYHSLDVAAVGARLLYLQNTHLTRITTKYNIPDQDLIQLCTFMIALHDIGKFSRSFQGLVPELWPAILGEATSRSQESHWQLSHTILMHEPIKEKLSEALDLDFRFAVGLEPLLKAVAGHHGRPPQKKERSRLQLCDICLSTSEQFITDLLTFLPLPSCRSWLNSETGAELSFWLAGLTNIADWLGSNQNIFPCHPPSPADHLNPAQALQDYWHNHAMPKAAQAIKQAGLHPTRPASNADLKSLFNIDTPRPMQKALEELDLTEGPHLIIVEDATGSGKTEAATLLAQRMIRQGKADGFYFALPTMATANAIYSRMAQTYRKLYDSETPPSLALAHGKRDLYLDGFKGLALPTEQSIPPELQGEEDVLAAQCAEWIADDRRKTFLAEIGVGTIDQALMAVLPLRFQAMRLWGLVNRVLIIDEAHAYDAYMSKEIERLLHFHSAYGGSAILLTATLTAAQRSAMIKAYKAGLNHGSEYDEEQEKAISPPDEPEHVAYPLVTIANQSAISTLANISPAEHTVRDVAIERIGHISDVIEKIADAQAKGAAIAWIRNAVDDAIEAVELLAQRGIQADLFHARFAMGDRQKIEQEVLQNFGPNSTPEQRAGRVLVSTQIIEQSLDIDLDIMITDLAPVDLLIQRAGRLWRHMDKRPASQRPVEGPTLTLFAPDPAKIENENWLYDFGTKGAHIYPNHGLLWRTAHSLLEKGKMSAPGGLRPLLEYVYSDMPEDHTPSCLHQNEEKANGEKYGDVSTAEFNLIKFNQGYSHESGWRDEKDIPAPTRLGEKTQTLRLARIEGGRLVPLCPADTPLRAWALSEVSANAKWFETCALTEEWQQAAEDIKKDWPKWQQSTLLAPVDENGQLCLIGQNKGGFLLSYCSKKGLERKKISEE